MVKILVKNWEQLVKHIERIKEADLFKEVMLNAVISMEDEIAKKFWSTRDQEDSEQQKDKKKLDKPKEASTLQKKEKTERKEVLDSKKEILEYFQERSEALITQKELMENLGVTRNILVIVLNCLQKEKLIKRIRRGKYQLYKQTEVIQEEAEPLEEEAEPLEKVKSSEEKQTVKTKHLPKSKKSLKALYQKNDYREIIDYICNKSEMYVNKNSKVFETKQEEMVTVIRILQERGFIEEEKVKNEGIKYKVNNAAKVWYELLFRSGTEEMITMRVGSLSRRQVKVALEEGIEKGTIAKRDKFFYTVS